MRDHSQPPAAVRLPQSEIFMDPPVPGAGDGDRAPPRRLSMSQVVHVLSGIGDGARPLTTGKLRLSAARPIVPGRGYLFVTGLRVMAPENPSFSFVPDAGAAWQGDVEIWLTDLEAGTPYLLEIRVGGWAAPGAGALFRVSSSEGVFFDMPAQFPAMTVPMVIPRASGPMALVKLTAAKLGGWDFYDVTVSKVGLPRP